MSPKKSYYIVWVNGKGKERYQPCLPDGRAEFGPRWRSHFREPSWHDARATRADSVTAADPTLFRTKFGASMRALDFIDAEEREHDRNSWRMQS